MATDSSNARGAWGPAPLRPPSPASESDSDSGGGGSARGPRRPVDDSGAPETQGAAGGSNSAGGNDSFGSMLARFVEEAFGAVDGLISVHVDRAKLSMRRTIVSATIGVGAVITATFGACAAVLALVRGTCGGFAELWGGREWTGDLAGGVLVLALLAGGVALALRISARSELARLKAKYERKHPRDEHDTEQGAGDGRGVPRSGGSPSARARGELGAAPR